MDLSPEKLKKALNSLEAEKTRRALKLPPGVDPAVVRDWFAWMWMPELENMRTGTALATVDSVPDTASKSSNVQAEEDNPQSM
jgi:hypothetical protein